MPRLWPNNREPQLFNTLGLPYALRAGLLRIANGLIHVGCENGESCGANLWVRQTVGLVEVRYQLQGAGALYAIAMDESKEIEDICRVGMQLEEGVDSTSRLAFQFTDRRVHGVVIGIRLNEGLPDARQTGVLDVAHVELNDEMQPHAPPPTNALWLILVPVTTATTGNLERTYRFLVKDTGTAAEAVGRFAGTSLEQAIENTIESLVFARVNHQQMFELRVSRTAFEWPNLGYRSRFLHAGRRYDVYELV